MLYSFFPSTDVALSLIQRRPDLATARTADNLTLLRALALRAEDFPSGTKLGVWESCIYPCQSS